MSRDLDTSIGAVRAGPGRFVVAAEHVNSGLVFVVDGYRFRVVSRPVPVGGGRYLANVAQTEGPAAGRLITAELHAVPPGNTDPQRANPSR